MSAVFCGAEQGERDGDRADRDGSAGQDAADDRTAVVRASGFALEADGADAEFAGAFGFVRSMEFVCDAVFKDDWEVFFSCVHVEGDLSWLLELHSGG